jgi:chromosome segregation ATPase
VNDARALALAGLKSILFRVIFYVEKLNYYIVRYLIRLVKRMFEPCNMEEYRKSIDETIEELEQENKRLHEEKTNLLEIEAKLQAKVSEEVSTIKQENDELKIEIETLRQRCERLTQYLNKHAIIGND